MTIVSNYRLIRDEDALPNYEAAANDAIRAGLMDKRYFWMVTLASLCVRENNAGRQFNSIEITFLGPFLGEF